MCLTTCVPCSVCSNLPEEQTKKNDGMIYYFYTCTTCGNTSGMTAIQNAAPILWNQQNDPMPSGLEIKLEIDSLMEEKCSLEDAIDVVSARIEYLLDLSKKIS